MNSILPFPIFVIFSFNSHFNSSSLKFSYFLLQILNLLQFFKLHFSYFLSLHFRLTFISQISHYFETFPLFNLILIYFTYSLLFFLYSYYYIIILYNYLIILLSYHIIILLYSKWLRNERPKNP